MSPRKRYRLSSDDDFAVVVEIDPDRLTEAKLQDLNAFWGRATDDRGGDLVKQPSLNLGDELIIDNFAGGGGTSTGIEQAFGRPVDLAINHDPEAIAMHVANHPHTRHLCESVWEVDPREVTGNRPVGLVWLSPDCKHFSKAKGGKPVEKKIRGLAWVALRWAAVTRPRVIMLENVEEFTTWGPLAEDADGKLRPCPKRKGQTFGAFVRALQRQERSRPYCG